MPLTFTWKFARVSDCSFGLALESWPKSVELQNLLTVSYTLATNLHAVAAESASQGAGEPVCLLIDRNKLGREYANSRDYTFFPLAFHPAYGNLSSPEPPAFQANNRLAITRDNMSYENEGADVVQYKHFQAYSNIKRTIRHRADDLLASQGLATGALTLPPADTAHGAHIRTKRQKLPERLEGRLTPDNPEASTPFARERQRILANITGLEKQYCTHILRKFPPAVFLGILAAYSTQFERAIDEMKARFYDEGSQGLGLLLSEGVAALDRLGKFCFTGDPRVLP
ncbi:uncharacterized protein LMH87_007548 [Akanthomyces muscarius]|uniref:Uncharacterized protein n=1 Tax=Akanthomyces muscarius TaxID=2231603 RepID=A0A9W8QMD5_AKAMU|nr:uncharacterized protein LMH87_007548 [Akanthomyces muscarius]KAJ4161510.1 hypothetical protein LMH87_007548 [Akanthomyces muscarius]